MIRVLTSGGGKMGRAIVGALAADATTQPVGVVDALATATSFATAAGDELPMFTDAARACADTKPDVVIDFSNAAWTPVLTAAALEHGVRPVIGTSGLDDAYVAELTRTCAERKIGGVLAANFALGAVLLMHMSKIAARFYDSAEIIELHHDQKVDAPSGTSIATARGMLEARDGREFAHNTPGLQPIANARDATLGGITLHSVRLPGLVAHQQVMFGATGETLTIRHDSNGRDSFMPGILLATKEVMHREELVIGLESLLGLTATD